MLWSARFVMVHVPRTGGTVLTEAFGVLPFVSKDVLSRKHAKASEVKEIIGEPLWEKVEARFCVARGDLAIAKSYYRHVLEYRRIRTEEMRKECTVEWWDFVTEASKLSFEQFVEQYPPPRVDDYADLPEVMRLSLGEAYSLLKSLTGFDPGLTLSGEW